MYYWVYDYSPLVSGSIFVIGFIFTTFLLIYLFRRFAKYTFFIALVVIVFYLTRLGYLFIKEFFN